MRTKKIQRMRSVHKYDEIEVTKFMRLNQVIDERSESLNAVIDQKVRQS